MSRRRGLSAHDAALWAKVTESIKPLPGRTKPWPPEVRSPLAPAAGAAKNVSPPNPPVTLPKPLPPLAPMEPRLRQKLGRGRVTPDARLDLHGLRQDEAHGALRRFLIRQQQRGSRVVLVITGKGGERDGSEPGVLRRHTPHWLSGADLRHVVLGFEEASRAHGGAGALYVRLRRLREERPYGPV